MRNVDEILFIRVILNFQVGIILKTYPGILAVGVGPKSLNLILIGIDGKAKAHILRKGDPAGGVIDSAGIWSTPY